MPSYETLCILHPELPETRVKELTAWMQKILEGAQGTVVRMDEWGMRDLGFRLKKQRRGYYVRIEHEASPLALKELERNLRLSEDVLRFLSVRRTPPAPAPTPASSSAVPAAPSSEETSVEEQPQ
ncbi:MAG TPA: 30S ribosomal protein S6 [Candidatus Binatia bacterium]|jgi:small subunit ribosomal protein S6|nr:30S ribosomal protein S6 [Candidatus Binatia bacterium]